MRPLQLLFALVKQHVPMDASERVDLENEITKDYDKIPFSKEAIEGADVTIKMKVKRLAENPYTRLMCACLFIPLSRYIADYIAGVDEDLELHNKSKGLI